MDVAVHLSFNEDSGSLVQDSIKVIKMYLNGKKRNDYAQSIGRIFSLVDEENFQNTGTDIINNLPSEIKLTIFSFLDSTTLGRLSVVSKEFQGTNSSYSNSPSKI